MHRSRYCQDRQIRHFAGELPDYLDPVLFGHHDSGDDERRTQPATDRQSLGSVRRLVNLMPCIGQRLRNRDATSGITVNDEVFAQFIGAQLGRAGGVQAAWVIYAIAGTAPVWAVGAERQP